MGEEINSGEIARKREARQVLRYLSLGLHPRTGEPLPYNELFDDALVIRALMLAVEAMREVEAPARGIRRETPARAGQSWTSEEDLKLQDEFEQRIPLQGMVAAHERRASSILARLVRLSLADTRMNARRILAKKERLLK